LQSVQGISGHDRLPEWDLGSALIAEPTRRKHRQRLRLLAEPVVAADGAGITAFPATTSALPASLLNLSVRRRGRMWTSRSEQMADGRLLKVAIDLDALPVSYAEVLRRWQQDADFRSLFIALLADSPFSAFRWETPPITTATANRPFEFVLLDSPW